MICLGEAAVPVQAALENAMDLNVGPQQLAVLAERKLGQGATIRATSEGWSAQHQNKRVAGKTWISLVLSLENMPDVES
jgi:hypothetical protein